jgi:hypothetical protein
MNDVVQHGAEVREFNKTLATRRQWLEKVMVTDQDTADMAVAEIRELEEIARKVDAKRKYYIEPSKLAIDRINADMQPIVKECTAIAGTWRGRLLDFQRAEDARRREAEAAARRQAEEAARKQREEAEARAAEQRRLADEAAKAGDVGAAAAAAVEAQNTLAAAEMEIEAQTSAALAVQSAPVPRAAGVGVRENWQAEVTDIHALIAAAAANPTAFAMYLQPNEQALRATAKATKGAVSIPGVRIFDQGSLSVRRVGG